MINASEVLGYLRDPGPEPPADDRRARPRTPLMQLARLQCEKLPGQTFAIRLLDASFGGVGFWSPIALDLGHAIEVSLETPAGVQRQRFEVMHCEFINEDSYRVGARTTEPTVETALFDILLAPEYG